MIKQSNIKFHMENNSIHQNLSAKHEVIQIQETNLNPIIKTSSSHCSLIETSLKHQRLNQYQEKSLIITSETKNNLNKLQKITDDVKFLTKQLQLSINQNNNSSSSFTLDERLIGEICYQLERRILIQIFSSNKQFYGYSLRYLGSIIENEENEQERSLYQKRFDHIKKFLMKTNFHFHIHSIITFNFINKYGIYFDYQWLNTNRKFLSNINEIQLFCSKILSKNFQEDLTIILYSLELISKLDKKPLFYL